MLHNEKMMKIENLEDVLSASLGDSEEGRKQVVNTALEMVKLLKDEVLLSEDTQRPSAREEVAASKEVCTDSLSRKNFMERMSRASHVYTGLEAALEWLAEKFQEASGITTTFTRDDERIKIDKGVGYFLYEIAHELLTNIGRHAEANRVSLIVEKRGDNVRVSAEDDGKGFDKSEIEALKVQRKWYSFMKIGEGVQYLGGVFRVESAKGKGTRVLVEVPATISRD
jgi:two-component system NarL family sensor kinase